MKMFLAVRRTDAVINAGKISLVLCFLNVGSAFKVFSC